MVDHQITLPYPPSLNNIFVQAGKKRVKSSRYTRWRAQVGVLISAARIPTVRTPCHVVITLTPPDKRHRDCDNLMKPILDALVQAGVLATDDERVVRSSKVQWSGVSSRSEPQAVVEITKEEGPPGCAR